MKRILVLMLAFSLLSSLLCACTLSDASLGEKEDGNAPFQNEAEENEAAVAQTVEKADFSLTDADYFTSNDKKDSFDAKDCIKIELNGNGVKADSGSVLIQNGKVTVKKEGDYLITGSLDDGMLVVDADKTSKIRLIFDGVKIHSETSAALYVIRADKVFVTLSEGSKNELSGGEKFVAIDENNVDGAIFSKEDLTVNGSGSLTVTSPAGHGIVSKDDLVFTGGKISIACASHALDANDSIRIKNTSLTATAGKDALHAENKDDPSLGFVYVSDSTLQGEAQGDGIDAGAYVHLKNTEMDLVLGGGSKNGSKTNSDFYGGFGGGGKPSMRPRTTTTADGSTSMKGIKGTNGIKIESGTYTIDSADDAVHSNMDLIVSGGTFRIKSGDDAFHADDTLTVSDGSFDIETCYEGLEAHHVTVSGGSIKLVATDDGVNAAGGNDGSGWEGGRDGMFGGRGQGYVSTAGFGGFGGFGGMGGMGGNSDGSVTISGGTLFITSYGDGIDANGTLTISGGHITIQGPTTGDTATLDYDLSGIINGGTFIGTGAAGMAQTFSDSSQGVISLRYTNQKAETTITLKDKNGRVLVEHTPKLDFIVIILSSPDLIKGEEYQLTIGNETRTVKAN